MKYKTIPENKTSNGHTWRLNKWFKYDGELKMCQSGFHCSDNFIDAMGYVSPGYVAFVEVRGKHLNQSDKSVHEEMRIIRWKKWTKKDSVSLAIFAAELVLKNYEKEYPNDLRLREAIEAAKKVLKQDNEKNKSAESAAWSAAKSAAASAAWSAAKSPAASAGSAAKSAAASAASAAASAGSAAASAGSAASAAKSAAGSAWWSAKSAAKSAGKKGIINKCHKFIMDRKFK